MATHSPLPLLPSTCRIIIIIIVIIIIVTMALLSSKSSQPTILQHENPDGDKIDQQTKMCKYFVHKTLIWKNLFWWKRKTKNLRVHLDCNIWIWKISDFSPRWQVVQSCLQFLLLVSSNYFQPCLWPHTCSHLKRKKEAEEIATTRNILGTINTQNIHTFDKI